MKIKRILLDPDPKLWTSCVDLDVYDAEAEARVRKMFKLMYRTGVGVGLAASQVGWPVRLFIMTEDNTTFRPDAERIYWNPRVSLTGQPVRVKEGCLSLPGVYGQVLRYPECILEAMTPRVGAVRIRYTGIPAQIVQHEVGHLDGMKCWDLFEKDDDGRIKA